MDSGDTCPPTPVKALSGDAHCRLSDQNKEESDEKLAGNEGLGEKAAEVQGDVSAADELPQSLEEGRAAGTDVPSSPGQPRAASPDAEAAEADQLASLAVTVDTVSVDENIVNEMREEAADVKADSRLDAGKVSDLPAWVWFGVESAVAVPIALQGPDSGKHLEHLLIFCLVSISAFLISSVFLWGGGGGNKCSEFPDWFLQY